MFCVLMCCQLNHKVTTKKQKTKHVDSLATIKNVCLPMEAHFHHGKYIKKNIDNCDFLSRNSELLSHNLDFFHNSEK